MGEAPSATYKERLDALDNVVRHCIAVSNACSGIPSSNGAHYYASVLFTSLCTRAVSLAILLPESDWATKKILQWDYSSVAGLVRSILEVRLAFFYLCSESCDPEEWNCRWNLFDLHDRTSRLHLFEDMPGGIDHIKGFSKKREELRARLLANRYFLALPQKERNKLINGGAIAVNHSVV